jgi:hypothetical protein
MAARGRPRRVLYVVACGGRPAGDLAPFVEDAQAAGWEVCVIATPSALKFMDLDHTINKWAAGISDTLALGLLNEALGLRLPVVAVPFPNIALAQHPAFRRSMRELEALGVRLLFDPDVHPLPTPNLGPASRDLFPWLALREELAKLTAEQGP